MKQKQKPISQQAAVELLEQMARIAEGEDVTFCKVTTPANTTVIDKYALQKLLNSKPQATPVENQKTTYLRCNREGEQDVWESYVEGVRSEFRAGILVNANLTAEEQDIRVGCGGSYHIGMAAGFMASTNHPVKVPASQVRRLYFDQDEGRFLDRQTGAVIKGCDYLILKPDCSAEWIASPEQAKILGQLQVAIRVRDTTTNSNVFRKAAGEVKKLLNKFEEASYGSPEIHP